VDLVRSAHLSVSLPYRYFSKYGNIRELCCFVLFFRGKGDYFRLGHGNDSHVRKPQIVEGLKAHKVVDVAVGALHCLAVTEEGEVS